MPNLLAHFGVQGVAGRVLLDRDDVPWILLGCVIPDVPWILHRALRLADPALSPYDARLYAVVQSSLLFSCVLAGALAALARRPGRALAVLAANAGVHLLLDALQTKLGNGVHLFAPLSWELLNLGLFWPESFVTLALTALGLAWAATLPMGGRPVPPLRPEPRRTALAASLAAVWLLGPLPLLAAADASDTHSVRTLRQPELRPGRPVAFDRVRFRPDPGDAVRTGAGEVVAWSGERLRVEGIGASEPATVSLRGRFLTPDRIRVSESHVHWPWLRDGASYLGLFTIAAWWAWALRSRRPGAPAP